MGGMSVFEVLSSSSGNCLASHGRRMDVSSSLGVECV